MRSTPTQHSGRDVKYATIEQASKRLGYGNGSYHTDTAAKVSSMDLRDVAMP